MIGRRVPLTIVATILVATVLLYGACTSKAEESKDAAPPAGQIVFAQQQGAGVRWSGDLGKLLGGTMKVVNADGSGLTTLTTGPGDAVEHPTWNPDGTRVAYDSGLGRALDYSRRAIFTMNSDGSNRVQLTHAPMSALWPTWSPDGGKIAFSAYLYLTDEFRIAAMDADGSQMTTLTTGYWDWAAAWAPDGKVFFLRMKPIDELTGNYGDLYFVNSDGTGLVQLTSSKNVGDFALSPDGSKIAFHDEKAHKIMLMPSDASTPPTVLVDQDFKEATVGITWAPDGRTLAMAGSSLGALAGSKLYTVNSDGSNLTEVPNVEYAIDPAWRPE